jgi:hypothetical protein
MKPEAIADKFSEISTCHMPKLENMRFQMSKGSESMISEQEQ